MNFTVKSFLFTLAFGGFLLTPQANAQEVYNFYFQKAQPKTPAALPRNEAPLEQDSISHTTESAKADLSTTTLAPSNLEIKTELPPQASPARNSPTWTLTAGFGTTVDHARIARGPALGAGFSVNHYFSVEAELMTGKSKVDFIESEPNRTYLAGVLGLALTPVRIDLFGPDRFEASVLLGGLTTSGRSGNDRDRTRVALYAGLGAAAHLTEHISILVRYRFEEADLSYGQSDFNLGVRF